MAESDASRALLALSAPSSLVDVGDPTSARADVKPTESSFAVSQQTLERLFDPKAPQQLASLGGVDGLCASLDVDLGRGVGWQGSSASPLGDRRESTAPTTRLVAAGGDARPRDEAARADDERALRRRVFGSNAIPQARQKSLWAVMLARAHDKILVLLTISALVSFAIGLFEDFRTDRDPATPRVNWIEGPVILIAVLLIIVADSATDVQKEHRFRQLNARKDDRLVRCLCDGMEHLVPVAELVVGDVVVIEPGDVPAADGVLVSGSNVRCDESAATGEAEAVRKTVPKGPAWDLRPGQNMEETGTSAPWQAPGDPFILSGSKVVEGTGRYVVCAVGESSVFGRTLMGLRTEDEETPLQAKLHDLADYIAKLGAIAAFVILIVLLAKYLIVTAVTDGFGPDCDTQACPSEALSRFAKMLVTSVAIIVVAIPEGLPLAVSLALMYGTIRMLQDNNLVRVLASCETMGGATTVCSDKTGTLTENRMTVVTGRVGAEIPFGKWSERPGETNLAVNFGDVAEKSAGQTEAELGGTHVLELVRESVAINSTAFWVVDEATGAGSFVGSQTETALLNWTATFSPRDDYLRLRSAPESATVSVWPFSSLRKAMATLVKLAPSADSHGAEAKYRVYVKGAAEIILERCENTVVASGSYNRKMATVAPLTADLKGKVQSAIGDFAGASLRAVAMSYRDLTEDEYSACLTKAKARVEGRRALERKEQESRMGVDKELAIGKLESVTEEEVAGSEEMLVELQKGQALLAVVGIQDPVRKGVPEAVEMCKRAGVDVRMVTGDNLLTAQAIARECGILTPDGVVMEGPRFRQLSPSEMRETLPKLQVLARSSPIDKLLLVKTLKEMGETVAVTGDGTNDGPALKAADVGFSMGISGTEVAKEASAIVLMDDNFASIVKAIMWGRSINAAVKKFLQFQVTVNITAVAISFVSGVVDGSEQSILTAVQLLWVNLIMDTLAALALSTEAATMDLLDNPPEGRGKALIGDASWKMILGQAVFQIIVELALIFAGPGWFGLHALDSVGGMKTDPRTVATVPSWFQGSLPNFIDLINDERLVLRTIVFNSFVFMQIWNMFNARRTDNTLNIFVRIDQNLLLVVILVCVSAIQVILVLFGGIAFSTTPLNGVQWGVSMGLGLMSLPVGFLLRLLPDRLFVFWKNWLHTKQKVDHQV